MTTKAKWIIGFIVLTVIGMLLEGSSTKTSDSKLSPREMARSYADSVKVNVKWRLGGFDNVMIADLTLINQGGISVKDMEVECALGAKSGTIIGYVFKDIYEVVPAGDTVRVKEINMGIVDTQSETASCKVRKLSLE